MAAKTSVLPFLFGLVLFAPWCQGQTPTLPQSKSSSLVSKLEVVVRWSGERPAAKPVSMSPKFRKRNPEDAAYCDKCQESGTLADETLVIDPKSRGIRDVAVLIQGFPNEKPDQTRGSGRPAIPKATVDNRGCRFSPRVQWAPVGKPITIKNSDPFIHNARILGRGQRQWWNALVPAGESVETHVMKVGGVYSVVCDVHPWMKCWVIGTSNPWVGVTDETGQQGWPKVGLPESLTVHLWHPSLGRVKRVIANPLASSKTAEGTRKLRLEFSQKDFQR